MMSELMVAAQNEAESRSPMRGKSTLPSLEAPETWCSGRPRDAVTSWCTLSANVVNSFEGEAGRAPASVAEHRRAALVAVGEPNG